MSGVIDSQGRQWECCNSCGRRVLIEQLFYEKPSPKFIGGRDLCESCWDIMSELAKSSASKKAYVMDKMEVVKSSREIKWKNLRS